GDLLPGERAERAAAFQIPPVRGAVLQGLLETRHKSTDGADQHDRPEQREDGYHHPPFQGRGFLLVERLIHGAEDDASLPQGEEAYHAKPREQDVLRHGDGTKAATVDRQVRRLLLLPLAVDAGQRELERVVRRGDRDRDEFVTSRTHRGPAAAVRAGEEVRRG